MNSVFYFLLAARYLFQTFKNVLCNGEFQYNVMLKKGLEPDWRNSNPQ